MMKEGKKNSSLINGNNKQETYWGIDLYSW